MRIRYIKRIIPVFLKNKIKMMIGYYKNKTYYKNLGGERRVFLMGVPSHGNLGDQAITYAEREFLAKNLKKYEIIEIDTLDVLKHIKAIKKYIKDEDIVILNGGGNLGIEYPIEEEARREVIIHIKSNPIILFPQTIDFGKSEKGKKELEISKKIYNSNPNLTLIARENTSYRLMQEYFPNNKVLLTPDIVLSLNKQDDAKCRSGAMICMREDCESILSAETRTAIAEACQKKFKQVQKTDTVVKHKVSFEQRNIELEAKWNQFRQSELVVTDRLHGMVFAAITGTPCIVMSNYNHKVKGTYEWIKDLGYIKFVNSLEEVQEAIRKFEAKDYDREYKPSIKLYKPLISYINSL